MDWPIKEVARMTGVTARTLRHYGEKGLLPPARTGASGRRYYEEYQLLRLQQILVLRALGIGVPEIGRILSEQVDKVDALRGHHQRLLAERDRLDTLASTVSRTIAELEQSRKDGNPMTIHRPENLFEGVQRAFARQSHCVTSSSDLPQQKTAAPRMP
ncbi:MerR family transcriptional regulator [Streptomyces sp. NPDC056501]|uniref:MerR family transcriptional regulator n=1 Tax=Streptomyces sp. NPDC056501 TaxID=3345841 RepID=UPI00369C73C3